MPTCVTVFTRKTSPFAEQTSPFSRNATEIFTELCVEPVYAGFTFMDGEPYLFMDGTAKLLQA